MSQTKSHKSDLCILDLKATARTPMFSGENKTEEKKKRSRGNALATRKTGDGFAAISIYGILRRYAENIYRPEGACDIGKNSQGCGKCITCDLFGSLGKKGRATFEYLKTSRPFREVVKHANHTHLNSESNAVNSFIEVEEIQEGTEFTGRVTVKNPTEKDIEILCAAIKAAEVSGVGGWTKRDMGRANFEIKLTNVNWAHYKDLGMKEAKKLLGAR